MKQFLVAVFFFSLFTSFGQTLKDVDSLVLLPDYSGALQLIKNQKLSEVDNKTKVLLLNKEAEIQILLGNLTEAEKILTNLSNQDDRFLDAVIKSNLGFLKINQARFDQAQRHLEYARDEFFRSETIMTKEGARCLANIALLYSSTGKYNQALENELEALSIRQKVVGEDSEEAAASLNDLGLIYSQIDTDKALAYYESALAIYQKRHGSEHPKIAIAKTNLGFIFQQQELLGDAINSYEEARAIWEKIYPGGHPNVAQVLSQLGSAYKKLRNIKAAEEFYTNALSILKKSYGGKHPDISQIQNQLGLLKLDQQRFNEALALFHEAIISNAVRFQSTDYRLNPEPTDFYNAKVMVYSIHLKAQALEARHFGKTLKLEDLDLALQNLLTCDKIIDYIRHHSTDENDKLALGESANDVYEDGVKVAEAISLIALHPKKYIEYAFYFAEKSKSAVLQESIADAQAKSFAGIPDDLLEQEKILKASIAFTVQKLSQKPTESEEQQLRQNLFQLNQQYSSFTKKLEQNYPNYFNLKFNTTIATIPEIQKKIDDQTAVVSYFIAEKSKRLFRFVISRRKTQLKNLTLPENFDRLLKGFTNSLFYSDLDTYQKSGQPLARLLVPRVSQERLIIIPSGRLGTLPLEALPIKSRKHRSFETIDYVISKYAVSYEFSAGLLLQKNGLKESSKQPSILLCAPIQFESQNDMGDLPGTEQEVKAISKMFNGHSTALTLQDANEQTIKNYSLSEFDYLHFATHGIVDEINPELSRIFLRPTRKEDGNLFAGEIYNLKMNAQLAVLSACQTGLGKFSKGEGVIGLSRALAYAGAKNLVVSYWSVSDESTAQMMNDFYREKLTSNASDFSSSLRKAKLNLITSKKYSAPYFWAPFVLIGN